MCIAYHQNLGLRVNQKKIKKNKKGGDYDKNGMEGVGLQRVNEGYMCQNGRVLEFCNRQNYDSLTSMMQY